MPGRMRVYSQRGNFPLEYGISFLEAAGWKVPAHASHEVVDGPMKLLRIFPLLLIFLGAVILSERPAYGYTDPGTGLLAIQAAGSALVATGWYLRRKIQALFHSKEQTERDTAERSGILNTEDPPRV